jgi:hypothetical protein
MKPPSVELPKRLRTLERDSRGYPIPFIVMRDRSGLPHFTINDQRKLDTCVRRGLCGLCGKRFGARMWFIGGPRCFTEPTGAFIDPPSHRECGEYALKVCPYLAAPNYRRRIDARTLRPDETPDGALLVKDSTVPDARPETFGFGETDGYARYPTDGGTRVFVIGTWTRIEYWREGEKLS